ncbi:MAG: F0F1 ATP synthase subunit C [Proteobacteria bacterium]|nr:F0F1 ATP synthase subunit C [Pseudomonadota bacterium]
MDVQAARMIGAGLAMIGLLGAGLGLGNIFSTLVASIARNPETSQELFAKALIGAGMTELVALLAFVIGLFILFI